MSNAYPIDVSPNDGTDAFALTVSENTLAVTTVQGSSEDASAVFNYTITGGDDAALFTINRATGELHFIATPDYENPTNAAADATSPYLVTVTVSDGSTTHDLALSVGVSDSIVYEGTNEADVLAAADVVTADQPDAEMYGFEGRDVLTGGDGNDLLDGGAGADTLTGGAGDDTYVVDSLRDKVIEDAGNGLDTVITGLRAYHLADNVEHLVFQDTGDTPLNHIGYGNDLDNFIVGGAGSDVLLGRDGNDTILGGDGKDTLNGGNGNDWLDGGAAADGTITADRMIGGAGDDSFVVDDAGDKVVEGRDGGTDTVYASITYTLAKNVENLALTGTDDLNGIGNAGNNVLTGNAGANELQGGAGNDTLDGGLGQDTLTGGKGADHFLFGTDFDGNADTITDFRRAQGDKIVLDMSIFTAFTAEGGIDKAAFYSAVDASAAPDTDAGAAVRIIYDKASGALYYDADGNGTDADPVQFAQIGLADAATHPTLIYSDFLVVA